MTNHTDRHNPRNGPGERALSEPEVTPTAPEKREVGTERVEATEQQQPTARELAREFRWFEAASLFINGALAIIGVIALCIYGGQLAEMRKATQATKVAADAAKQSADITEHSFQMERRRAEDQEEAICRLRTDGMAALDRVGHVRVINSGKTKARNVEAHVDTYLADAVTLNKLRDLGSVDISTSELGGNDQSLDRGINLPLTARDWKNLADTNQVIIDSGHVRYENGFGRVVDEPFCDGWWYFRTPEDKNNPIQGRGTECGQIPQNVAGVKKQKAK